MLILLVFFELLVILPILVIFLKKRDQRVAFQISLFSGILTVVGVLVYFYVVYWNETFLMKLHSYGNIHPYHTLSVLSALIILFGLSCLSSAVIGRMKSPQ